MLQGLRIILFETIDIFGQFKQFGDFSVWGFPIPKEALGKIGQFKQFGKSFN